MSETMQTALQVMIALCFLVILIWPDFLEDDIDLDVKDTEKSRSRSR
jgi:hypothetical protein